jgi:uncharacterized RDD family membrane protein YckC
MELWYYAVNNQRQGPIPEAEFQKLVASGFIRGDTLVWRTGMPDWQPYATVAASLPAVAGESDDTAICAMSGKRYPKREMIQYEGRWISAEHRDEFFQRLREGVPVLGPHIPMVAPYGYGGFWIRFVAKFVDGLITGVVGVIFNIALGAIIFGNANYLAGSAEAAPGQRFAFMAISNLASIGMGLGYMVFFIGRYAATPGKMAVGLKLVRPDGSPLGTGRIIGRYFAEILSGLTLTIGYIIAAFDDEKRSLHDQICDTRVVKTR